MNGTAGYTNSVLSPETDALITQIIGCAIRVYTELGPGFLETIYASALGVGFEHSDIAFEREKAIMVPRGQAIAGQRLDFSVEDQVILSSAQCAPCSPWPEAQCSPCSPSSED